MPNKFCLGCGLPVLNERDRYCSLCKTRLNRRSQPQGRALYPGAGLKEELADLRDPEEEREA